MVSEPTDVEKRLVDGEALDERGDRLDDVEHEPRHPGVLTHVRGDEGRPGRPASCLDDGHGRPDTELARLVARGGYDTAIPQAPDHDGHAPQRRVAQTLDLDVEGVHVDVQKPLGERRLDHHPPPSGCDHRMRSMLQP